MALIEVLGYGALFMLLLCGNLGIIEAFMQQKKHCRNGNFRTVQQIKISKDSITGSGVNVNS